MNLLYQGINDPKTKTFIKDVEQTMTTINVKTVDSISKPAYDETVNDLRIATTNSDGNCFFQAIAIAINNYNYTNQTIGIATRIGYEVEGVIYGGSTQFNQETIRFVVFDFLKDNAGYLIAMLEAQKVNLDTKNIRLLNHKNGQLYCNKIDKFSLLAILQSIPVSNTIKFIFYVIL
jgi:hypothetical protein